jgi:hypothetical protein
MMETYRGKLTDEIKQRLLDVQRKNPGADYRTLANLAGVAIRTFQRWLRAGMEAKSGRYHDLFVALDRTRDETIAFLKGRHLLLGTGGLLRSPATKTHFDDHGRPYTTDEAEYDFSGAEDPSCPHERRLPERPDMCATCGAVGRVVYKDHVVKPNASTLEFHLARLDPVATPATHHEHHVSGRVEIEHRASADEWLKRLAGGYAILAETNLPESFLDRTLTGFAQTVPGAQPKQVNEIKSALKRLAAPPVETVALPAPDALINFWIELEKDGEWHRIAEHSAHTEASACKGFLIGYCAAKWPEDRELAKKMAGKLLPRVRAVPKM